MLAVPRQVRVLQSTCRVECLLGHDHVDVLLERSWRRWTEDVSAGNVPVFAVGGYRVDMAHPELSPDRIRRWCSERCHPRFGVADGFFGQLAGPTFDVRLPVLQRLVHVGVCRCLGPREESNDPVGHALASQRSCTHPGVDAFVEHGGHVVGTDEGPVGDQVGQGAVGVEAAGVGVVESGQQGAVRR